MCSALREDLVGSSSRQRQAKPVHKIPTRITEEAAVGFVIFARRDRNRATQSRGLEPDPRVDSDCLPASERCSQISKRLSELPLVKSPLFPLLVDMLADGIGLAPVFGPANKPWTKRAVRPRFSDQKSQQLQRPLIVGSDAIP